MTKKRATCLSPVQPRPLYFLLLLLLPFFAAAPFPLAAQSPIQHTEAIFERYMAEQGLYAGTIMDVTQDHQGFIWIGAIGGLYRFDGHEFYRFPNDRENPKSINAENVNFVYEDRQHKLWIGTGEGGLKLLDRSTGTFVHFSLHEGKEDLATRDIITVLEHSDGQLWFGTANGLYAMDRQSGQITFYPPEKGADGRPRTFHIRSIAETQDRNIWVCTLEQGLFKFDRQKKVFTSLPLPWQNADPKQIAWTNKAMEDSKGDLWVATGAGLYRIPEEAIADPGNVSPESIESFQAREDQPGFISSAYAETVFEDRKGNIWVSTKKGLNLFDREKGTFTSFRNDKSNDNSISFDYCRTIYEDDQGNIWIGTMGGGLNRLVLNEGVFKQYEYGSRLASGSVFMNTGALVVGNDGQIYLAGRDGHIAALDPVTHNYRPLARILTDPPAASAPEIYTACVDHQGKIWMGTIRSGIHIFDPTTASITPFSELVKEGKQLSNSIVPYIFEDSKHNIWIATIGDGLARFNPHSNSLTMFTTDEHDPHAISNLSSIFIAEDLKGYIWVVLNRNGLNRYDPDTGRFKYYPYLPNDERSPSSDVVHFVFADSRGDIWLGTKKGLNRYNESDHTFKRLATEVGLVDEHVKAMQEDEQGRLWFGTDRGMFRFDPSTKTAHLYDQLDGIQVQDYNPRAAAVHKPSQQLIYGTKLGLIIFNPQNFQDNSFIPPVELTRSSFYFKHKDMAPVEDIFIGQKSAIELSHKVNIMEFEVAALNYHQASKNQYQYSLASAASFLGEKEDNNWFDLETEYKIRFTNLKPGDYVLHVKGSNNDSVWNEKETKLDIKILPPWWRSNAAYAGYILMVAFLIYGLYRFQLLRQLEKQETQNLRELNNFKTKLYTNITHEFRTPLTVISGMVDQIGGFDKERAMIKRNSATLLNLVNQILDLRKLELGKLKLDLIQSDVVLYLQYIINSYQALAEMKGVSLHLILKERELYMDFDKEKLLRILSNLITNAIKFTPKGGNIYVELERSSIEKMAGQSLEALKISVMDTGIGIPEEKQKLIFDRFYQVENDPDGKSATPPSGGTKSGYQYRGPGGQARPDGGGGSGVGLALTKELVALMGGQITLHSQLGKGTTFLTLLPITRQAPFVEISEKMDGEEAVADLAKAEVETTISPILTHERNGNIARPNLLLIEDNPDVMQYLVTLLESRYELFLARDGEEGIEMALEHIPELIISDVMMPRKDGFEVCGTLKKDIRTSHIPIILLTAKASVESRIQGLERGADAYLAKPFHHKELFIRLEKLAELRRQLQQRYQSLDPNASLRKPQADPVFKQEDEFIDRLRATVEDHMDDHNFGISQLCRALGMSRSQLHLKIKALTNKSTSIFIRTIRLYKAKELLQNSDLNVTQVAYEVGFNDPGYFSRTFKEEFGIPPKALSQESS